MKIMVLWSNGKLEEQTFATKEEAIDWLCETEYRNFRNGITKEHVVMVKL